MFITGAIASYTMMKYKVLFDGDMIQNIFETNQSEAYSYLSVPIVVWVLLAGVLPAVLLFFVKIEYPAKWYQGLLQRGLSMLASLAVLGIIAAAYYQDYASVGRNNQTLNREITPANYMYSTTKYLYKRYLAEPVPFQRMGDDAKRVAGKEKPTMMFLVVGRRRAARTSP